MASFNLNYPHEVEGQKTLAIESGQIMFMVGPNGTGKSTLMHMFTIQNNTNVRRITAHRQVWFNSDSVDLTPASRIQTEQNITNIDRTEQSRWKDDYAQQRSQATIFDLIDAENIDARKIAEAARDGNMESVASLALNQAPVAMMNDILRISNLHFQISIDPASKLVATREGYPSFSIAELSDGERNALLIISNVLTAKENTLILLDEPERHLHRSIVSPLISTLLSYRNDCAFVISTHDVTLPHDQEHSSALLLRKYNHRPKSWVVDYVPSVEGLDENVAVAILGSRRTLLFVEGQISSLDLQLYQILYPKITIKPLGSCIDVERVVKGIRESSENHWVSAFGVIDRDNRSDEECEQLFNEGIIPLNQYSVESLYYHPSVIRAILSRVATVNDINPEQVLNDITESVISSIAPHKNRMAARLVQRKVKDNLSRQAPDYRAIMAGNINIEFSTGTVFSEELQIIDTLLVTKDIEGLISRYPVRETPALGAISEGALFTSKEKYEQAVRKMIIESKSDMEMLRTLLAPVTERVIGT
ncbi:MAG: AAA family ATPase [Pseudomonadota bacterium]|nr:AAA family ATPase [Pseudomonadota bacterium]